MTSSHVLQSKHTLVHQATIWNFMLLAGSIQSLAAVFSEVPAYENGS
jgi:hypothetical protein